MGIVFILLAAFLTFSFIYYGKSTVASRVTEPIYQGNTGKKVVAITVNVDWGEEFVPQMLEIFDKKGVKVTFFVTGKWAKKNQELLKKMSDKGHSIQNHGYEHVHFNSLSIEESVEQIKKAEKIIYEITGRKTKFFASPYGEQSHKILTAVSSIGYDLVMWSVDTIDWQRPDPGTIVKRVANKVHNDAIILMHPTEPTVKALPELLERLQKEGYKMVTIEEIVIR
ncbi:MAG: polysaccharide deacetylase family protein [Thermosyntropha sp.]|nr:polysaccharide deacetylase family protein [Thermosyntropha sp.]